ncbi:Uncharacterised protein [uncultured archaeon]|nr:Uncharacterised protein [uncultured archaeon]
MISSTSIIRFVVNVVRLDSRLRGGFGTKELADNGALKYHEGVIVFAHGTFAAGKTLEEAYFVTAQHSCKLKYYWDEGDSGVPAV